MESIYSLSLTGVIIIHFLWIIFVITGWIYCAHSPILRIIHSLSVVYGVLIETLRFFCPLTHLEYYLRMKLAMNPYDEPFINHYLESVIYMNVPQNIIVSLAILLLLVTFTRYRIAIRKHGFKNQSCSSE